MGLVTSPHTRTPEPKDNNQRALAAHPKGRSVGGARVPDLKHPAWRREAAPPPPSPSGCLQRVQSQLARVCAVRLVAGAHANSPAPKDRGPWAPAVSAKNGW